MGIHYPLMLLIFALAFSSISSRFPISSCDPRTSPRPSHRPLWYAILIAMNLQTSFLTPPFGSASSTSRGRAAGGQDTDIYYGVAPSSSCRCGSRASC